MKTKFQGKEINISNGKLRYCKMDGEYNKNLKEAEKQFVEAYKKTGNLQTLVAKYWDFIEVVEDKIYVMLETMLKEYGNIEYSSSDFSKDFAESIENRFQKYDQELSNRYYELVQNKEEKAEYRKNRRDNRRQWYGITQEGQNKAAIKNMESYVGHSMRNFAGNTATAVATNVEMSNVFNDKKRMESMCAELREIYSEVRIFMYKFMLAHSKNPFEVVTSSDVENARELLERAKQSAVGSAENIEILIETFETHPGLVSTYYYTIENYGDCDNVFEAIAEECGIELGSWKIKKLKEKLKDCTPKDLSDEEKIFAAIKIVEDECRFWGIESAEYTKTLKDVWARMDQKLRTVESVEYATREEAELAREDEEYLKTYSREHELLNEDLGNLEQILLPVLKGKAAKENIKYKVECLRNAQDLRNIQTSANRIMLNFLSYEEVKKCFAYGHIFSQKIGYEKFEKIMNAHEKVALVYDTALMNKGIRGLLLTNKALYYYQEQEIREIPLEKYKAMQICAGKIFIQIEGEDTLNTDLEVKIDQLDYTFFAGAFDNVVQMCRCIKNAEIGFRDEEVYDNIIVRSKFMEWIRHNKLKALCIAAAVAAVVLICFCNITYKNDKHQIEVDEEGIVAAEMLETDNTPQFSEKGNVHGDNTEIAVIESEVTSIWYIDADKLYTYNETLNDSNGEILNSVEEILNDLNDEIQDFSYAIVDMDGDSKQEIIFDLMGYIDDYYMIIHHNDESDHREVYVKVYGSREMQSLRKNGVFCASDGAGSTGYYMVAFQPEMKFTEIEMAYIDEDGYSVQGESVTEDEFYSYYESVLNAEEVEWIPSYIESPFDDYFEYGFWEDVDAQYVLAGSSDYYLDWSDLEGLSESECKIARNEIYARYGRKFNDEELQAYFDSCSWYEGTILPEEFNDEMLTDIEKANRDLIIQYEEAMGYR